VIRLTIPGRLIPHGELLRMHWAKRARLKADLARSLWYQARGDLPLKKEKRRHRVFIMVYQPTRKFDKDNLHASCKLVIDALKDLYFIYNDSPAWLDLEIRQAIDHKNPRVEIELEELA
jgi:Holliday junction resolvase RusA-like endonuclease